MNLIILEIIKAILFGSVIITALYYRNKISVNIFWLTLLSSILMFVGSLEDIQNLEALTLKSFWWFLGNVFVVVNYFVILRRSWLFYGRTKKKLNDFIKLLEKDTEEIRKI